MVPIQEYKLQWKQRNWDMEIEEEKSREYMNGSIACKRNIQQVT